jgi:hypothetical protein
MIFRIDYQDHYSYFDKNISVHNFLKYSEKVWNYFNPDLHYQNRLRHVDYLSLFDEAKFSVVYEDKVDGNLDDIALIKSMPIDNQFKAYSFNDLAVRYSLFVLRKQ